MISEPTSKFISNRIPPNYSTWQTIEMTYLCCKDAVNRGVKGDFVECGVAAGNNFGAMLLAGRKGWGFDSFDGIPWAGPKDDQQPGIGAKVDKTDLESSGVSVHRDHHVVENLKLWQCGDNYKLVKGWFQHTLPVHEVDEISVLRLDGDLYESTLLPLQWLWPNVSLGGILIIDDWDLKGCRDAVFDFFEGSTPKIISDTKTGPKYFIK